MPYQKSLYVRLWTEQVWVLAQGSLTRSGGLGVLAESGSMLTVL